VSSLEEIKKKKMQEMQQEAGGQEAQQAEAQMEAQLDSMLRSVLTPEAKARLSNIRLVNKELYLKVAQSLLYLAKSGQIQGKIDDAQLKALLEKARGQKREISIKRK
jgi:programmed cell death protein 5